MAVGEGSECPLCDRSERFPGGEGHVSEEAVDVDAADPTGDAHEPIALSGADACEVREAVAGLAVGDGGEELHHFRISHRDGLSS